MLQLLGHLARWIVRRLVRIYYPKIEISGREHVPRTGAVLLAANHANSLIDPAIVGLTAKRPVRFFAKAPLFETPLLGQLMRALGMLPAFRAQDDGAQVRRNLESLNVGALALAQGHAVGIFPEGRSHDSLKLEQIRSGAARMAVQAVEQGARDLLLVPIGINYQRKQLFRSAIWVRVGRPIHVARFLAQHGEERKATRALTAEIEARLKRVVLHLSDAAFEPFLDELELLLPPPRRVRGHVAISALRQRKRLADAMNHFLAQDRPRAEAMAESIREYRSHLAAAGLTSRSPVMRFRTWRLFFTLAIEAVWLAFWFPAAVIGTLFHIVPFTLVRALSRKIQDGPTTTALSRLGFGLPIYALWYAGAWWAVRSYFLPWVAWTFVSLMPLAGALALSYAHRARDICGNWLQQLRVLMRRGQLRDLRAEQRKLREKLGAFVDEFSRAFPSLDEQPRKYSRSEHVRLALRWAAIGIAAAGIFVWQNWYFAGHGRNERMNGLNLAGMSTNSLAAALQGDETALRDILVGVNELEARTRAMMAEFAAGKRSWYRQSDDDDARALLLAYMNYRTALLRIVWRYQDYEHAPDEALRLRAFLASYTSASVLYETSLKFVTFFETAPDAIRKLNEPEPLWSIPPGLYDTVRRSLADPENRMLLRHAREFYDRHRADFARHHLAAAPPFDRFHAAIERAEKTNQRSGAVALAASTVTPLADARDVGKEAIYRAQKFISTWVGDTKVREPRGGKALIQPAHLNELRPKLKPGDLMLERRNWFLSNAFLPGYWPHSALYVGTAEDLKRLGLDRDPRVQKHWQKFLSRDDKGHERVIIEAISEGVVFTSMEHSVGEADAAAFLRPNIPEARLREVIARAFSHVGKPYDFEFDFFSTDKLVCSEVVYRAYDGDIQLPLVTVMGRKTLPPIEIVRQCVQERAKPPGQFSFVAYLDGNEYRGRAVFAGENEFYETVNRSGMDLLQPRR
jgi:1-acyl-sn-glycerol-3-phosphate acyltransferase